jgi:hypothetical protein
LGHQFRYSVWASAFFLGTRTGHNVPGPDRMHLYLGTLSQNV